MSARNRRVLNKSLLVAWAFAVVVLAAIVVGVVLLDSPAQERLRRLDERRVSDLRELSYAIDAYWTREGTLPSSLDTLALDERIVQELADPVTGNPYAYRPVGERAYELCASFDRESVADDRGMLYRDRWQHGPGEACFEMEARDVDREPEYR